jgi:hypothetical protein
MDFPSVYIPGIGLAIRGGTMHRLHMFELQNGRLVDFFMPHNQGKCIAKAHFRRDENNLPERFAGNFFAWEHFKSFLKDTHVRTMLTREFEQIFDNSDERKKKNILEIEFSRDIGWDFVMNKEDLTENDLAVATRQSVNKRSTALFLPEDQIEAPPTNIVTIVGSSVHRCNPMKFFITSLYPGHYVGNLQGDMTEQYGLVWLPRTTVGEPRQSSAA